MDLSDLRKEYRLKSLHKKDLLINPIAQFEQWFKDAEAAQIYEPNAMALSTVDAYSQPSSRMVLLKQVDENGFYFFTSQMSRKAMQLEKTPFAAALFFWKELERQIQIEGSIEPVSSEISTAYFNKRPRSSRIAAWASKQSSPLSSRAELEEAFHEYEKKFVNQEVPTPEWWTGFLLKPIRMEFWQGRESRLHDRFLYLKQAESWTLERLSP